MNIDYKHFDPVDEIGGYAQELVDWLDFDPDYEPINHFAKNDADRIWLSYLFASFDSIATASVVFQQFPEWPDDEYEMGEINDWFYDKASDLYVGKERKRLKYNFMDMLHSFNHHRGDLTPKEFLDQFMTEDPEESYDEMDDALEKVKYLGPLTRYDFMELLQRQANYDIIPTHMGTIRSGCLGPVKASNMVLEMLQLPVIENHKLLHERACVFSDIIQTYRPNLDHALIETTLCKYQKLVGQRYYTGAEIDEMLGEMILLENRGFDMGPLFEARANVFDPQTLTEHQTDDREFLLSLKKYGGEEFAPVTEFNTRYRGIK